MHYACISTVRAVTEVHTHEFYEFFLVTKGSIYHIVNGQRMVLHAGALVLICPHDQHYYGQFGKTDCEFINLAYPVSTHEAVLGFLGIEPAAAPVHRLTPQEMEVLVDRLQSLAAMDRSQRRPALRALLAELFVRYFRSPGSGATAPIPPWLGDLTQAMRQPANFVRGLPRLHELSPVTPEHLCRSVRSHFGKTPTEWINDLRLGYAADLLAHTDQEIVAISLQAGFDNLSHFYHLFRQHYHLSPARYRKAHKVHEPS